MNSTLHKNIRLLFFILTGLFFILLLTTGFNPADDVVNVHYVLSHSYISLCHTPFMNDDNAIMFRPGLAILQKVLQIPSSSHWIMLRLFQISMTTLFLTMLYRYLKENKIDSVPIFTALFYTISNPFLYAPYVVYGYVGALALLPALCLTLLALQKKSFSKLIAISGLFLCLIGPFIQEFGLLLIPLWCVYFIKHSQKKFSVLPILCLAIYFYFRHHVLGSPHSSLPFTHGTGFGTKLLEPEILNAKFTGIKVYMMYLYTLIAQTGNLLFSQPNYGYVSLTPFPLLKLYRLLLFTTSTIIIGYSVIKNRKKDIHFLFISVSLILMNLPLSFSYARPRILIFASVGYACLLAWALHHLPEKSRMKWCILLCLGWSIHCADNIGHVWNDRTQNKLWYTTKAEPLRGPTNVYQDIQKHYKPRAESK